MPKTEAERELLLALGYDPDDPNLSVEFVTAPVTEPAAQRGGIIKEHCEMADMEKRVGQYVTVRDIIRKMEARHEEELAEPKEILQKLGGVLQKFLDDNNLENLKTAAGTCYISTKWSAPLVDADAFMRFVIENAEFDLLERRASSTAVKDYVEKHNQLPAGVSLNALASVGVRRPAGKAKS